MSNKEGLQEDIEDIKNALNAISNRLRRIERALSHDTYIAVSNWPKIRYSHKERRLSFDNRYAIEFVKNEADLLANLFYKSGKKAGCPKADDMLVANIAKENERLNLRPNTHKATYQALKRIHDRVLRETQIELFSLTYNLIRMNHIDNTNPLKY